MYQGSIRYQTIPERTQVLALDEWREVDLSVFLQANWMAYGLEVGRLTEIYVSVH